MKYASLLFSFLLLITVASLPGCTGSSPTETSTGSVLNSPLVDSGGNSTTGPIVAGIRMDVDLRIASLDNPSDSWFYFKDFGTYSPLPPFTMTNDSDCTIYVAGTFTVTSVDANGNDTNPGLTSTLNSGPILAPHATQPWDWAVNINPAFGDGLYRVDYCVQATELTPDGYTPIPDHNLDNNCASAVYYFYPYGVPPPPDVRLSPIDLTPDAAEDSTDIWTYYNDFGTWAPLPPFNIANDSELTVYVAGTFTVTPVDANGNETNIGLTSTLNSGPHLEPHVSQLWDWAVYINPAFGDGYYRVDFCTQATQLVDGGYVPVPDINSLNNCTSQTYYFLLYGHTAPQGV